MGAHLHWLLNTCANSCLISSIVKIHGVPSVLFITCHMSGHMNVYSNCVTKYSKEMLDKEIWGKSIILCNRLFLQVYFLDGI